MISCNPRATELKEALEQARLTLESVGIRYFLCCGTALGAVRANDFLSDDIAIDIGIFAPHEGLLNALILNGFAYTRTRASREEKLPWTKKLKVWFGVTIGVEYKKTRLDFIVHETDERQCWFYLWTGGKYIAKYAFPVSLFEKFEDVELLGNLYPVPCPKEEYLRLQYGENWRTPILRRDWDFIHDRKNLVELINLDDYIT